MQRVLLENDTLHPEECVAKGSELPVNDTVLRLEARDLFGSPYCCDPHAMLAAMGRVRCDPVPS